MAIARLKFLGKDEEDLVHSESLRCLEKIGVMVKSESVLKMLERVGASVDHKRQVAKIPENVVMDAVKKAPKQIRLGARSQSHVKQIPVDTSPLMATTGLAVYTVDLETRKQRSTTNADLANFSRIADAMQAVDICWTTVTAGDVPQDALALESLWTAIKNNTKHIQVVPATHGAADAKAQVDLASFVVGGPENLRKSPIFSVISCSIAPLTFERLEIEAQAEFSKWGIPVTSMSMSIGGLSAPVTIAACIENINAENLASNVIAQAAGTKAPFIYSSESAPMDMMTGVMDYNSYHLPLLSAGAAQMAQRYGFPTLVSSWGMETKDPGWQGTFGETFGTVLNTFTGSDIMSGAGSLDHAKGAALEQVLMDSYLWEDIRNYLTKFSVTKEKIALDVIEAVGHGNSFLTHPHTVRNFKSEHPLRPKAHRSWQATLSTAMAEEARKEAKTILRTHEVPALDKDVLRKGDELIRRYEASIHR